MLTRLLKAGKNLHPSIRLGLRGSYLRPQGLVPGRQFSSEDGSKDQGDDTFDLNDDQLNLSEVFELDELTPQETNTGSRMTGNPARGQKNKENRNRRDSGFDFNKRNNRGRGAQNQDSETQKDNAPRKRTVGFNFNQGQNQNQKNRRNMQERGAKNNRNAHRGKSSLVFGSNNQKSNQSSHGGKNQQTNGSGQSQNFQRSGKGFGKGFANGGRTLFSNKDEQRASSGREEGIRKPTNFDDIISQESANLIDVGNLVNEDGLNTKILKKLDELKNDDLSSLEQILVNPEVDVTGRDFLSFVYWLSQQKEYGLKELELILRLEGLRDQIKQKNDSLVFLRQILVRLSETELNSAILLLDSAEIDLGFVEEDDLFRGLLESTVWGGVDREKAEQLLNRFFVKLELLEKVLESKKVNLDLEDSRYLNQLKEHFALQILAKLQELSESKFLDLKEKVDFLIFEYFDVFVRNRVTFELYSSLDVFFSPETLENMFLLRSSVQDDFQNQIIISAEPLLQAASLINLLPDNISKNAVVETLSQLLDSGSTRNGQKFTINSEELNSVLLVLEQEELLENLEVPFTNLVAIPAGNSGHLEPLAYLRAYYPKSMSNYGWRHVYTTLIKSAALNNSQSGSETALAATVSELVEESRSRYRFSPIEQLVADALQNPEKFYVDSERVVQGSITKIISNKFRIFAKNAMKQYNRHWGAERRLVSQLTLKLSTTLNSKDSLALYNATLSRALKDELTAFYAPNHAAYFRKILGFEETREIQNEYVRQYLREVDLEERKIEQQRLVAAAKKELAKKKKAKKDAEDEAAEGDEEAQGTQDGEGEQEGEEDEIEVKEEEILIPFYEQRLKKARENYEDDDSVPYSYYRPDLAYYDPLFRINDFELTFKDFQDGDLDKIIDAFILQQ